ncbi:Iron-sulfur cluster carrier protein [Candidatus Tiddalikarchaeum anstoanum]|nr:Iron-sulfur cluster carrier protein [Candidatus Tiddalikarchaeum anstoanum]
MTRVIVFASGKGGVGKSTMSCNVAAALHQAGKNVLIIDANVTTPNLSILLGITDKGPTLHDVLSGAVGIESAIYKTKEGLKVIPGGLSFHHLKTQIRKQLSKSLLDLLGKYDYIIVDSSAGLGKEAELAVRAADELVLVTNPELPALTDALRAKKIAEEDRVALLGVIINKKTGLEFDLDEKNIAEFLELPILGVVPYDIYVMKSVSEKRPVIFSYPKSKSAKIIKQIVNKIAGEELFIEDKDDKSFFQWLKRKLGL